MRRRASRNRSCATAALSGSSPALRTKPPSNSRALMTIAADGRNSALVPKTGVVRPRSRFRARFFGLKRHCSVPDPTAEPEGTVGLHLIAGGYVGTCRIETGMTNLCGLLPESVLRRYRGDLDRLAAAVFPGNTTLGRLWESATPLGAWKTVADVQVTVATPQTPGIFYAGDCQGTIDPLGGQGMTLALLGAEMLAPFVTRALVQGGAPPRSSVRMPRPGTPGSTGALRSAGRFITPSSILGSSTPARSARHSPRASWRSATGSRAIRHRRRESSGFTTPGPIQFLKILPAAESAC